VILTGAELAAIRRQAEAEYPAECCGVALVRREPTPDRILRPCRNIQDALHARDPARYPSDARRAYHMDPRDILAFTRLADEGGYAIAVIYHSHVDVGAYFSPTDRRQALLGDRPAYPDATYVVVAVNGGRAGEARGFRWDAASGDFVEVPVAHGASE
jgi:proteasome lid subunit RPN8/RPN11